MSEGGGADLLQRFVDEALVLKATGGRTALYSQLVLELRQLRSNVSGPTATPEGVAALVQLLQRVTGSVGLVRPEEHDDLLREALSVPLWLPEGAALRAAGLDLALHLAVAVPAVVDPCLRALVHGLVPPAPRLAASAGALGEPWAPAAEDLAAQDEIVAALARLVGLVPTAAPRALPVLLDRFPHPLRDRGTHCFFLRAALALARGVGALREALLAAAVQHLLALDVEIRWEDIVGVRSEETREEAEGAPDEEDEPDLFELEGMSREEAEAAGGGWEGGAAIALGAHKQEAAEAKSAEASNGSAQKSGAATATASPPTYLQSSREHMETMADKLDSLMEMALAHIAERAAAGDLGPAFATLLAVFERKILHAHRSKFVQFVVFLAAAKDASGEAGDRLLAALLRALADESAAGLTRTAAAAYIASFLSRAQFLEAERVVAALTRLLAWALAYARRHAGPAGRAGPAAGGAGAAARPLFLRGPDTAAEAHAPFHAAVQGALYVLCYHLDVLVGAFGGPGAGSPLGKAASAEASALVKLSLREGAAAATPAKAIGPARAASASAALGTSTPPPPAPGPSASPGEQLRWVLGAALPALLAHPLDPLTSCATSVSAEFARQARRLRLHALGREIRAWEARAAGARTVRRPLEVFFPFDPYLLARSARYLDLEHTFTNWQRGRGAMRAGDEDEDDKRAGPGAAAARAAARGADARSDASSSSDDDDDDVSDASSSSSASDSDDDDLQGRGHFGSLPSSSCPSHEAGSWDHAPGSRGRPIPGTFRAVLAAGSPASNAASPDVMMVALGGSPFPLGMSPLGSADAAPRAAAAPTDAARFPQVAWRTLRGWNGASQDSQDQPVAMSCTPAP